MIRAISYTLVFCGASAGAAVALAMIHDSSTRSPVSEQARVAPMAVAPALTEEPIAVSFAPRSSETPQTPRIAPVLPSAERTVTAPQIAPEPAPEQIASVPAATSPAATPVLRPRAAPAARQQAYAPAPVRPAPAQRRAIAATTQGQPGEFYQDEFGYSAPNMSFARTAPIFEPLDGTSADVGKTWSTGVYR